MKLLKIAAISYAVKTLLIGAAWLAVPDLPERARVAARHTWAWMCSGAGADAPPHPGTTDVAPPSAERAAAPTTP